jgi:monovalent cation:H+ antiporter, CPA1 family
MNLSIEFIETLLLIAAVVSMTVRRLKIPYTVGLMLTGIVLAVSPFPTDDVDITKDLIFTILLPL